MMMMMIMIIIIIIMLMMCMLNVTSSLMFNSGQGHSEIRAVIR
jgi:hypothetical protein